MLDVSVRDINFEKLGYYECGSNWDNGTLPKFAIYKICGQCRLNCTTGEQRFAKLFVTGTRRPRPKSAFSRAIPRRQKNWLASPLVWVACFRLAGEASSLRRRARWRRQLAMKLTSTSRNRKESPREYIHIQCPWSFSRDKSVS